MTIHGFMLFFIKFGESLICLTAEKFLRVKSYTVRHRPSGPVKTKQALFNTGDVMKLAFVQYGKCVFHLQMITGILISLLFLFLFPLQLQSGIQKITVNGFPILLTPLSLFALITRRITFKNFFYESNDYICV